MNRLLYIRQEEVCGLILTTRLAGGGGGGTPCVYSYIKNTFWLLLMVVSQAPVLYNPPGER